MQKDIYSVYNLNNIFNYCVIQNIYYYKYVYNHEWKVIID